MARRLIGTATTNSQGIATVSYTGEGAGKLQLVAESGSLQSEIYELIDAIFYYKGTGGTEADSWTSQTGANAVSTSSDVSGTTFTSTGSSNGWIWTDRQGVTPSTTSGVWTGDFTVEFDIVSMTGTGNLAIYETYSSGSTSQTFALSTGHWKVERNGNVFTVDHDGSTSTVTKSLNDPVRIGITHIENSKSITFENFIIYPA